VTVVADYELAATALAVTLAAAITILDVRERVRTRPVSHDVHGRARVRHRGRPTGESGREGV
jgi:hypothetical protein